MKELPSISNNFFTTVFPLSSNTFAEFEKIFVRKTVPAMKLFIVAGQKNNSEYFILDGFARSFLPDPDGEETTIAFFKPCDVLTPHIIRTKNDISSLNFQSLTELSLVEFDASKFLNLMIHNLELREFGNTVLKNELIRKTEKEIALASQTATARLREFRKDFGILENLIPHPYIASYLGITNVSLSRLRAKV